jgi:2-polyprenyl-3-methyl-5-hydroxy-6-metoxy-1,4-benzoquinol methylase
MTFDEMYRTGSPPWDIGRPQAEVLRLLASGAVTAPVLDVGCGTGETALACAARGLEVLGVDAAPTAIERATAKAASRKLAAQFRLGDALRLETLGRTFATVLDIGLFHTFDDEYRAVYVESLASVVRPGGRAFVECFSDSEPDWGGPRRVRAEEIPTAFAARFEILEVRPTKFETVPPHDPAHAWLVSLRRRTA